MKHIIHIVLSSSNEFIEHCATTIASIIFNIQDGYFINFYILSFDISDKKKKLLNNMAQLNKCSINFPALNEKDLDIFNDIFLPSHVTKMTYARVLIPNILPSVDKVIFIDSDTIVRTDISKLYNIDLFDNLFAMVEDANWINLSKRLWGTETKSVYFNAGVMLINSKKLRESNYLDIIKQKIALNFSKYKICDQDVINDSFKNHILRLDITWNFYHQIFRDRFHVYTPKNMEEYDSAVNDPSVVHFVGPEKPWFANVEHKYKDDYLYYKKKTPFFKWFEFNKFSLNNNKYKSFSLFGKCLYLSKFDYKKNKFINSKKISDQEKKFCTFCFFRNLIKIDTSCEEFIFWFFYIPLLHKMDSSKIEYFKICGIPVFYHKKILEQFYALETRFQSYIEECKEAIYSDRRISLELLKKISSLKVVVEAQNKHKFFSQFKNLFNDKDVVLVCSGPSANKYIQIDGAIHVGVNGSVYLKNVNLDYLFAQDYTIKQRGNESLIEDVLNYKEDSCIKFLACVPDNLKKDYIKSSMKIDPIPFKFSLKKNCYQYLLDDVPLNTISSDLEREPFGNFNGTVFSALQFILYCNPRRLFLVGWDCNSGYAYGKKNAFHPANYQIEILKKYFLDYINLNFPTLEIISINPIGLKGIFKDIYME